MHCLPQRLKSMFFEKISNGAAPKFQKPLILVFEVIVQPSKAHFLTFSSETKIMKITHSARLLRSGCSGWPLTYLVLDDDVNVSFMGSCHFFTQSKALFPHLQLSAAACALLLKAGQMTPCLLPLVLLLLPDILNP